MTSLARRSTFVKPLPRPGLPPVVVQGLSLLVGALLWELIFGYLLDIRFIPALSDIVVRWFELFNEGVLTDAIVESIISLTIGFLIAAVTGVALGVGMVYSRKINQMFAVYIAASIVSPGIVLGPVFFILFGLSPVTLIAIVVVFSFPFIVMNTVTAFEQVPKDMREMALMMGASRAQAFWQVTLRAAMPLLVSGLRIGMGRAVKGMFVGQLVVVVVGLGYLGLLFQGAFDAAGALAIGATVVMIAVVAIGLIQLLDRRLNWWVGR